jgi:hypothetical protein
MPRLIKVKMPMPSTVLMFAALMTVLAFPNAGSIRGMLFTVFGAYMAFMLILQSMKNSAILCIRLIVMILIHCFLRVTPMHRFYIFFFHQIRVCVVTLMLTFFPFLRKLSMIRKSLM